MINTFGKILVLVNVTVAIVLFTLALLFYTNAVDWGWKDPRKAWYDPPEGKKEPVNERVASELDRRLVALERANDNRNRALERVKGARAALTPFEGKFAENRRVYTAELNRLATSKDKIEVKEVKVDDQKVVLAPDLPYGRPVLDTVVTGVDKSYTEYLKELSAKHKAIEKVNADIADWTQKVEKITGLLNGKREKDGKVLEPGYYDLLEMEAVSQRRLREEIETVQPLRVRHLIEADLMMKRRKGLEKRLGELGEPVGK